MGTTNNCHQGHQTSIIQFCKGDVKTASRRALCDNDRGVTTWKQNKHPICEGVPIVKVAIFVLLRDESETVESPRLVHQQIMSSL